MKKSIKILIGILVAIILAVVVRFVWPYISPQDTSDEMDGYDASINYLNNEVSSQLLFYGEDIEFRDSVKYTKITSIDEKSIKSNADYVFLIISDLGGTTELDADMVTFLKEYADKNNSFNFYYVGTEKLDIFTSGIFEDYGISSDDMSFGYVVSSGCRLTHGGMWSGNDAQYLEKNKELLQENILDTIARIIESNE